MKIPLSISKTQEPYCWFDVDIPKAFTGYGLESSLITITVNKVHSIISHSLFKVPPNGAFTLPDTKADTETDKNGFYNRPPKLRKGNAFKSVCQEFCPQGGSACHPGQTPPHQTATEASWNAFLSTLQRETLKALSHWSKVNAKAKKIKEQSEEIKEKMSKIKENFRFHVRFSSV